MDSENFSSLVLILHGQTGVILSKLVRAVRRKQKSEMDIGMYRLKLAEFEDQISLLEKQNEEYSKIIQGLRKKEEEKRKHLLSL